MTEVSTVYGDALYALAHEEGLVDTLLPQLALVESCFAREQAYMALLSNPAVAKAERCALLDESMRQLHPYLLNFLKILVEKGYIRRFSACCERFRSDHYRDAGILPVTAATALPLTDAQCARLRDKLAAITKKTILLSNRVDERLLGGVRLDYDGKQLDDSICHRLDVIRQTLKNTVL